MAKEKITPEYADVPPAEDATENPEAIPDPEEGTLEAPTSNDVGEQTLTNADTEEAEEETE